MLSHIDDGTLQDNQKFPSLLIIIILTISPLFDKIYPDSRDDYENVVIDYVQKIENHITLGSINNKILQSLFLEIFKKIKFQASGNDYISRILPELKIWFPNKSKQSSSLNNRYSFLNFDSTIEDSPQDPNSNTCTKAEEEHVRSNSL